MQKIGFLPLVSLVLSSQLGVGIFMLPGRFSEYGPLGLFGWVVAGAGAILLAFIFSELCKKNPQNGGPHAYVRQAFGDRAAFFTGWAYWLISLISNVPLVIIGIGYLTSMTGGCSAFTILLLQVGFLSFITCLNFCGSSVAGKTEVLFLIFKLIPMLAIPIAGILFCNNEHFIPFNPTDQNWPAILQKTSLLAMWSFIGLESATAPAESVANASRIIPRAIFVGTTLVIIICLSNNIGIMALVPSEILKNSIAPYSEASKILFPAGSNPILGLILPLAVATTCLGSLNAWTLFSSYVAYGLASESLFPAVFLKKNRFGAPYISLGVGYLCTLIFTILCMNKRFEKGLMLTMDITIVTFLLIYSLCILAFLKLFIFSKGASFKITHLILGCCALFFCVWGIYNSGILSIAVSLGVFVLGTPMYFYAFWKQKADSR